MITSNNFFYLSNSHDFLIVFFLLKSNMQLEFSLKYLNVNHILSLERD